VCGSSTVQRRLGHLDGDRVRAGPLELSGERAVAGAEVQHAIAGGYLLEQERAAKLEVGQRELVGQSLPQLLVVVLDRVNLRHRGADDTDRR
jgi:hypothetical protein